MPGMTRRPSPHRIRTLIFSAAAAVILAALLAADLAFQGLAYQFFWSQTGEETPLEQLNGMVDWLGNLTRPQLRLDPMAPVAQVHHPPYGINTFLEQEVEPEKRERIFQMITEAGFTWIRQQFPWEDIEIHGRGDFEDRRNDVTGDGVIDAISAWDKYDMIVDLAEAYDVRILARLDNPPAWSHADPGIGAFAPPDDIQDFVNFAAAVAERYRGRITHYQIWNEPNIYPEWGEQPVDPAAYSEMLCRVYDALKAIDPQIIVISASLSPTIALSERNLNEFIYLQRMYEAGACFDVMGTQGYGFNSGPTDRRLSPFRLNYGRHLYLRDLMIANGDSARPIWITEAAWNPIDSPEVPPDVIGRENFGVVTREQAARYMPLAYQRAESEWPWVGPVFYWFFKRAADFEQGQSFYYFRMVEPDFTPLPIYDAMREHIAAAPRWLYPGVHQAEHWAVELTNTGGEPVADHESALVEIAGAQFGTAILAGGADVMAYGTGLTLRWQGAAPLAIQIVPEGESSAQALTVEVEAAAAPSGWTETYIDFDTLTARAFRLRFSPPTDDRAFFFDSITVVDRTTLNLFPYIALAAGAALMLLGVIGSALWARRRG